MTQRWKRKIVCVMVFAYAFALTVPFPVALAAERKSTVYIGHRTLSGKMPVCNALEKLNEVIAIHLKEGRGAAEARFLEYHDQLDISGVPSCFVMKPIIIVITEKYRQVRLDFKDGALQDLTVIQFEVVADGTIRYGVTNNAVEYPDIPGEGS